MAVRRRALIRGSQARRALPGIDGGAVVTIAYVKRAGSPAANRRGRERERERLPSVLGNAPITRGRLGRERAAVTRWARALRTADLLSPFVRHIVSAVAQLADRGIIFPNAVQQPFYFGD